MLSRILIRRRFRRKVCGQTDGATPLVKGIEHVGLTEGNVQRTPPTALAMITVEASIDAAERDSKWNAVHRPAGNEIKSRPDDANQMPVIFPAQIGLDLPAVVCYLQSSICNMKSPIWNVQQLFVARRLTQSSDARFQPDL